MDDRDPRSSDRLVGVESVAHDNESGTARRAIQARRSCRRARSPTLLAWLVGSEGADAWDPILPGRNRVDRGASPRRVPRPPDVGDASSADSCPQGHVRGGPEGAAVGEVPARRCGGDGALRSSLPWTAKSGAGRPRVPVGSNRSEDRKNSFCRTRLQKVPSCGSLVPAR
jgi:hypothetical protein